MIILAGFLLGISAVAGAAAEPSSSNVPVISGVSHPRHLRHFNSKRELREYFARAKAKLGSVGHGYGSGNGDAGSPPAATATVSVTAGGAGGGREESITNTQHEGVDEGSIIKMHGNYLVVLRRGRLFTIDISKAGLKPTSMIDAYGPDIDPQDTWYDEMLISGENLIVIGYSYDRGGTEIGLFRMDASGKLSYRSTYHLRSNDYYSSRNYSSRLIGDRLIFYSGLRLDIESGDPFDSFPALRRWHKGAKPNEFHQIAPADRVYVPERFEPGPYDASLHTVTTCQIGEGLSCTAEAVLGPSGDVFYVSPKNVYVWASRWYAEESKVRNRSYLFKMPLDGRDPSAIRVSGSPVDQFSVNEDDDGEVDVLVRADADGDGMWRAEITDGDVALLRLEPDAFSNGATAALRSSYQPLEKPSGYSLQNRFIGDYVLYGTSNYSENYSDDPKVREDNRALFVVNRKTRVQSKLRLSHEVERLDHIGSDGIVVGNAGDDLTFTSVRLDGSPRVIDTYSIKHASQGETRSQGFFYKPTDERSGVLGLPVVRQAIVGGARSDHETASVIYLRNDDLRFAEYGELTSSAGVSLDDACRASCIDWYGDARPIFAKGRVFALLGYELVEGSSMGTGIAESKRVTFAPGQTSAER